MNWISIFWKKATPNLPVMNLNKIIHICEYFINLLKLNLNLRNIFIIKYKLKVLTIFFKQYLLNEIQH